MTVEEMIKALSRYSPTTRVVVYHGQRYYNVDDVVGFKRLRVDSTNNNVLGKGERITLPQDAESVLGIMLG